MLNQATLEKLHALKPDGHGGSVSKSNSKKPRSAA